VKARVQTLLAREAAAQRIMIADTDAAAAVRLRGIPSRGHSGWRSNRSQSTSASNSRRACSAATWPAERSEEQSPLFPAAWRRRSGRGDPACLGAAGVAVRADPRRGVDAKDHARALRARMAKRL